MSLPENISLREVSIRVRYKSTTYVVRYDVCADEWFIEGDHGTSEAALSYRAYVLDSVKNEWKAFK
jgi:hypothetical protein